MNYFNKINLNLNVRSELINSRKKRKIISVTKIGKYFTRGDILAVNFWAKSFNYHFEGLCLSLKEKKMVNPNVTLRLRNVLQTTGVEVLVSYFLNRLYLNTIILDYKRKQLWYKSSKLYFLRDKANKASKVK